MRYLFLIILVPAILNAATYKERLDTLYQGDPRTYITRCGQDASMSLKIAYRRILAAQNNTFLNCMEAKKVDVDAESVNEQARKDFIKNELDWVKSVNCSNISISTSKDRFLRFICYYFKRY